jgi:hypothetical protein
LEIDTPVSTNRIYTLVLWPWELKRILKSEGLSSKEDLERRYCCDVVMNHYLKRI